MKNKAAVALGQMAARVNKAKGREYFVELGKKSADKRKKDKEAALSTASIDNERSLGV